MTLPIWVKAVALELIGLLPCWATTTKGKLTYNRSSIFIGLLLHQRFLQETLLAPFGLWLMLVWQGVGGATIGFYRPLLAALNSAGINSLACLPPQVLTTMS